MAELETLRVCINYDSKKISLYIAQTLLSRYHFGRDDDVIYVYVFDGARYIKKGTVERFEEFARNAVIKIVEEILYTQEISKTLHDDTAWADLWRCAVKHIKQFGRSFSQSTLTQEEFYKKLDSSQDYVCFQNGVMDIKKNIFYCPGTIPSGVYVSYYAQN